jgi:hypothetical protein
VVEAALSGVPEGKCLALGTLECQALI